MSSTGGSLPDGVPTSLTFCPSGCGVSPCFSDDIKCGDFHCCLITPTEIPVNLCSLGCGLGNCTATPFEESGCFSEPTCTTSGFECSFSILPFIPMIVGVSVYLIFMTCSLSFGIYFVSRNAKMNELQSQQYGNGFQSSSNSSGLVWMLILIGGLCFVPLISIPFMICAKIAGDSAGERKFKTVGAPMFNNQPAAQMPYQSQFQQPNVQAQPYQAQPYQSQPYQAQPYQEDIPIAAVYQPGKE